MPEMHHDILAAAISDLADLLEMLRTSLNHGVRENVACQLFK